MGWWVGTFSIVMWVLHTYLKVLYSAHGTRYTIHAAHTSTSNFAGHSRGLEALVGGGSAQRKVKRTVRSMRCTCVEKFTLPYLTLHGVAVDHPLARPLHALDHRPKPAAASCSPSRPC